MVAKKTGNKYDIQGKLSQQTYKGYKYWGFENLGFPEEVPKEYKSHKFTEDELALLELGKEVWVEGLKSDKGRTFNAYCHYGETVDYKTGKPTGRKGIVLRFENQ